MNLYYYATEHGNFGDDLNLWIWDEVLPDWKALRPGATLFGVGTILSDATLRQNSNPIVMGSGVGYGEIPSKETQARCEFRAVRGPLSAAALGLAADIPMLDPAMLIPGLRGMAHTPNRSRAIFIPHYSTANLDVGWEELCDDVGIDYVSPQADSKTVIQRIASSPLVLTESMHGAILADAYRVPWVPLEVNDSFNRFKWKDWAKSLDIDIDFLDVFSELRPIAKFTQDTIARLKTRQRLHSSSRDPGPGGPENATANADRRRLQSLIERLAPLFRAIVKRKLRAANRKKAFISNELVLLRRQEEFNDACARLLQEYSR